MLKKKYNGIWFYGLAGTGKSFASNFLKKKIKDKIILFDGDVIRKHVSFDLGYSLEDRKIQIKRVLGLIKIAKQSNIFSISSTVYLDKKTLNNLKKHSILAVEIQRDLSEIKKIRSIYKKNKNIVGKDIKIKKLNTIKFKNTGDKDFCTKLLILKKKINI